MIPIGDSYLEKKDDGSFQLAKPTIVWRFTKDQLQAEIIRLQNELTARQELLESVTTLEEE